MCFSELSDNARVFTAGNKKKKKKREWKSQTLTQSDLGQLSSTRRAKHKENTGVFVLSAAEIVLPGT